MNSKILCFVSLVVGAGIGSLATCRYFKKKYERIANEEIDSVKETFAKRKEKINNEVEEDFEVTKEDLTEYNDILNNNSYSLEKEEKQMKDDRFKPYVISPDEFGDNYDYDTESLTYYSDGVLTDDYDHPIKDVENTVGVDSLTHFGEYEDDSVFVRNDKLKKDYEILRDLRKYSDIQQDLMDYDDDDE